MKNQIAFLSAQKEGDSFQKLPKRLFFRLGFQSHLNLIIKLYDHLFGIKNIMLNNFIWFWMAICLRNTENLSLCQLLCCKFNINNNNLLILKCFIRIYAPVLVIITCESMNSLLIWIFQFDFKFVKVVQRILILGWLRVTNDAQIVAE